MEKNDIITVTCEALGTQGEDEQLKAKVWELMAAFAQHTYLKCQLIAALTEDDVLGFFAVLPLDNLSQDDFDDFMSSLMYFTCVKQNGDFAPYYHEFAEDENLADNFLKSVGLEPEQLAQSLDTIAFPEGPAVSIIKRSACGMLVLQSILGKVKNDAVFKELLTANMSMFGKHFFSFSGNDEIILNTVIRFKDGADDFFEGISRHVQLNQDFAAVLEKSTSQDSKGELMQSFSEFLMV